MKKILFTILLFAVFALSPRAFPQQSGAASEQKKLPAGLVVTKAALGTDVQQKKLVGESTEFTVNQKVFLFLELTGGPAEDITVTWKHADKTYETKLKVGGSPWHTWAYKTAYAAGAWKASVTDAAGTTLKELEFTVGGTAAK